MSNKSFVFDIKPKLEDCYICFEEIDMNNGAILPYKCRHHICIGCTKEPSSKNYFTYRMCQLYTIVSLSKGVNFLFLFSACQ